MHGDEHKMDTDLLKGLQESDTVITFLTTATTPVTSIFRTEMIK